MWLPLKSVASCVHICELELCLRTAFPPVFHIKSYVLEKDQVIDQKIAHISNKNSVRTYIFLGCATHSEWEEWLPFCWQLVAVFKGCLPIDISGPKSVPVWKIVSFVLYTTHNSNLRKWLSGNFWVFETVKMVWALASKFPVQFLLHFYVGMTLFWLHLNFYICIPWLNKLPVTFEK